MDPVTASMTLATVVGLICNFKQERSGNAAASKQDFFEFLEYHRHEEIKDLIVRSVELSAEVDNLLREDHAVIIAKLNSINELLATLISRVEGLRGFAHALLPRADLSDQAISILRQFVSSSSDRFHEMPWRGGFVRLMLGSGGEIQVSDDRFLRDDLDKLCELGFLTLDRTDKGTRLYRITREAAKYVQVIDDGATNV